MTTMLEKLGLSILDAHGQWELENNRAGGQDVWGREHVALLARAALLGIRVPSRDMAIAGFENSMALTPEMAAANFTAMIDEILAQGEGK